MIELWMSYNDQCVALVWNFELACLHSQLKLVEENWFLFFAKGWRKLMEQTDRTKIFHN